MRRRSEVLYRGTQRPSTGGRFAIESWTPSIGVAVIWSGQPGNPYAHDKALRKTNLLPTSTVHAGCLPTGAKIVDVAMDESHVSLGHVLRLLGAGESDGIPFDEVRKILNYLHNRAIGKVRGANPEFGYRIGEPDDDGFELDLGDILRGRTAFLALRDELEFRDALEVGDELVADTYVFMDAPAVQRAAVARGIGALRYLDVFEGGITAAPALFDREIDDLDGIDRVLDLEGEDVPVHVTVRPLVPVTLLGSRPSRELVDSIRSP